ncbi:hypothetical protein ACFL6H_08555 [Candidatus Latescibacterota bacterium]
MPALYVDVTRETLLDGTPLQFVSSEHCTLIRMPETGQDSFYTVIVLSLD